MEAPQANAQITMRLRCQPPAWFVRQRWIQIGQEAECQNSTGAAADDFAMSLRTQQAHFTRSESSLWSKLQVVRGGLLNLGFCILSSKVESSTPFLGCMWTNLAEIWRTFDHTLVQKSTKVSATLVHRRPRKGVPYATFEGKTQ